MERPTWNPRIIVSPVEDGYVAYDPGSEVLHHLNPVAALLSELCDGTRNLEDIHSIVEPLMPQESAGEIDRWIGEARAHGLLSMNGDATKPDLSAKELADTALKLRSQGKVQAAFLCQQRAAERDPGDAEKWCYLGDLAHILGRRDDARRAYEKYLEMEPDDAEVRHLLVPLRDEAAPARVPNECIQSLYRRFSAFYDRNMIEELSYEGPEHLQGIVESVLSERTELAVLDLGCGSGLAGVRFKPRASKLTGIDLSPEMVELARARNVYDHLEVAEITDWFSRNKEQFDLIVACDCLIYFGDLSQVATPASKALRPNGTFAFTVEKGEKHPFKLTDSGRYEHHPDHVKEVAAGAGFQIERLEEAFLRTEYGKDVIGIFVALRKAVSETRK